MIQYLLEPQGVIFVLEDGRLAGPQIYIARLMKGLDLKAKVLIPKDSKNFQNILKENNISFKSIFFLSRFSREPLRIIYYLVFFLIEIMFLYIFFIRSKEEIIYCAGGSWQIKAAIAGYLCRKKVIWHLNDTNVPKIVKTIFSFLSFMADGYVFASEASKSYYTRTLKDRHSITIPSPVEEFPDELRNKRIKFGNKDKIIVGTVCAINPTKNIEDFIELAKVLESRKENKFEFRILGAVFDSQKNYYRKLKILIKKYNLKNIFFLGETKEVNRFLNDFDFFVFTSKSESSPIVVKEAMIAGIPTLSYKVGDVETYMINEYNGFVCNHHDIDYLAHWIEELSINNDLRKKIAENSHNFVKKEFLYTRCANSHLKFFKEIVNS